MAYARAFMNTFTTTVTIAYPALVSGIIFGVISAGFHIYNRAPDEIRDPQIPSSSTPDKRIVFINVSHNPPERL